MGINRVLCVCSGNSDRSPFMAAVLRMLLQKAGYHSVSVSSAGAGDHVLKGGASRQMVAMARTIGIDLSKHEKRAITSKDKEYDLYLVVNDDIATRALTKMGTAAPASKMHSVDIKNPWPTLDPKAYQETAADIMAAMFRVMVLFFSSIE